MASITVNISDEQFRRLQQLAQNSQVSPEDLISASIEDWLVGPKTNLLKHQAMYSRKTLNFIVV